MVYIEDIYKEWFSKSSD